MLFQSPSFWNRLFTLLFYFLSDTVRRWFSLSLQENLIRDLGLAPSGGAVDLLSLEKDAAFGMYFSHYMFDAVRPTLPNTIDVGMIHCKEAK